MCHCVFYLDGCCAVTCVIVFSGRLATGRELETLKCKLAFVGLFDVM